MSCQRRLKERIGRGQSRTPTTRSGIKKRSTKIGNAASAHKNMTVPKTIALIACSLSITIATSTIRCSWPEMTPTYSCTTPIKSMMPAPAVRSQKSTAPRKTKNKESIWNGLKACWHETIFPMILFYFTFKFDFYHLTAICSIHTNFEKHIIANPLPYSNIY